MSDSTKQFYPSEGGTYDVINGELVRRNESQPANPVQADDAVNSDLSPFYRTTLSNLKG